MKFTIKAKGTADEDWSEHEIEAETLKEAKAKADEIYGVQRDKKGEQTNAKLITVKVTAKK